MDCSVRRLGIARPRARTYYERWMETEGIPLIEGFGVADVRRLPLGRWRRLGCEGAFIQLRGLDGVTGAYVGRIPAGGALEPERHLYEEILYIVEGEGTAEIQQRDRVPQSVAFEAGSVISPPINTLHRLINHSKGPALFLGVTTAPMVLDHFHNERFVFNSEFRFDERYDGEPNYFEPGNERYLASNHRQWIWETNFVPNVGKSRIDPQEQKGAGVHITQFEMSNNTLVGHLAAWPVGGYHKAHYHAGGTVLVVLRSEGYSLMWPNDFGIHPYQRGHGDRVVRIDWAPGSIFSPPANWFHQHFNTGAEPALQLALGCGSYRFPLGLRVGAMRAGVYTSVKCGGTLIEYEDEDPEIRRQYEAELARKGIRKGDKAGFARTRLNGPKGIARCPS